MSRIFGAQMRGSVFLNQANAWGKAADFLVQICADGRMNDKGVEFLAQMAVDRSLDNIHTCW